MEFKRLSDVEVVAEPTESANVLIEENGVIKKAPNAAVGGGYDAVIDLGVFSTYDLTDLTDGTIPAGIVKMIEAKIAAGEMPKLKGIITFSYYDSLLSSVFEFTAVGAYGKNQVKCYCDIYPYSGHYSLEVYLRDDDIVGGVDSIYRVTKL